MTSDTSKASGGVLIVDDDELIRETLRELVQMVGCSALMAANGREALKVMTEHRPCLVILDLLMPVMTGTELLEAMHHDPTLAGIPVVISTSAPDRAPSGVPILRKPINIESVVEWMHRTCACTGGLPGARLGEVK
jgi:CheY-like chemotaxis protein